MINNLMLWIVTGVFLILMTIMDLKHKKILSVIPTAAILFLVSINLVLDPNLIWYGVVAFVFAFFLYEIDFFRGAADIKAITMIGLLIRSPNQLFFFMLLIVFVGLAYQLLAIKLIHGDNIKKISDFFQIKEEVPFVPAITISYIILFMVSYVRWTI